MWLRHVARIEVRRSTTHERVRCGYTQWEAANILRSIEKKAIREAEAAAAEAEAVAAKQEKADAKEEKAKAHAAAAAEAAAAPEVV